MKIHKRVFQPPRPGGWELARLARVHDEPALEELAFAPRAVEPREPVRPFAQEQAREPEQPGVRQRSCAAGQAV